MDEATRAAIAREARACIDTPFSLCARTRGVALDCAGLLFTVADAVGLYVPVDMTYTRRETVGDRVYVAARDRMDEVELEKPPKIGQVLLLWIRRPNRPSHFGIVTSEKTMVHAASELRRVAESPFGNYWLQRVFAVFEFRKIPDANHRVASKV